jgi:hypothetical protein
MQEHSTVPLALEIGVASIVPWKHTELMVCYRPTRGVVTTKQTSPDALTSTEIGGRPRDAYVSFLAAQKISPCSRFVVV